MSKFDMPLSRHDKLLKFIPKTIQEDTGCS